MRRSVCGLWLWLPALALVIGLGCAREQDDDSAEASPPRPVQASPTPSAPERAPALSTEEGLIEAAAQAIADRDLEALRAIAAPELAADLRRIHDENPARFWTRGRQLVDDVRSGFDIVQRQDDSAARWRVLVRFDNGREETMQFTRVDGKLRIDQL